jgi:hypothetical protein
MAQAVLAPLEQATGADFRGYIGDLKEDMMDEQASKPAANATSYGLAVQFCDTLLAVSNERDALITRLNNNLPTNAVGGPTTTKVHPNWVDLAREQEEAAAPRIIIRSRPRFTNSSKCNGDCAPRNYAKLLTPRSPSFARRFARVRPPNER